MTDMNENKPYVWQMVVEAVDELNGKAS